MDQTTNALHLGTPPAAGSSVASRLHLPSLRELALFAGFVLGGQVAFGVFDEWRPAIKVLFHCGLWGGIAFFAGRAFWSWWKTQPTAIAGRSAAAGAAFSILGWLGVALAIAVTGMSGENYALIIIAPLTMLFGVLTTIGGVLAAGLGAAVVATGLTRPVPRAGLVVAAGLVCGLLNAGHVLALVWVYWGRG